MRFKPIKKRLSILGYIIISVVLLCLAYYFFQRQSRSEDPKRVVQMIRENISRFHKLEAQYMKAPVSFVKKDSTVQVSDCIAIVLQNDTPIYWNSSVFDVNTLSGIKNGNEYQVINLYDTIYLVKCYYNEEQNRSLYLSCPLFTGSGSVLSYKNNNIVIETSVSYSIQLSDEELGIPIEVAEGEIIYISFNNGGPIEVIPDLKVQICFYAFILILFFLSYAVGVYFLWKFNSVYAWIIYSIACIMILYFTRHMPLEIFNLRLTQLFSADLFSSSDNFNSLPRLLFHTVIIGMVFILYYNTVDHKDYDRINNAFTSQCLKWFVVIVHIYFFIAYIIPLISILIRDSQLSFSFYDFNRINWFSFLALFIMIHNIITLTTIIYSVKKLFADLLANKWYRLLAVFSIVLVSALANFWLTGYLNTISLVAIFFIFFILSGLLPYPLNKSSDSIINIFSFKGLVWYVIISFFLSVLLFYFNNEKEQDTRKQYAFSFKLERELSAEYSFYKEIRDSLPLYYMPEGDTTGFPYWIQEVELLAGRIFTNFNTKAVKILDREDVEAAGMSAWNEIENEGHVEYYAYFSLQEKVYNILVPFSKNGTTRYLLTELEIPVDYASRIANQYDRNSLFIRNYSVGIYNNDILISQTGANSLDFFKPTSTYRKGYDHHLGYSIYVLEDKGQSVVVHYERNVIFELLSMFCYSLITFFFITFLYALVSVLIQYTYKSFSQNDFNIKLSFRFKINIGIVASVFFSSITIATVSIFYFRNNNLKNKEKDEKDAKRILESKINYITDNILDNLDLSNQRTSRNLRLLLNEINSTESYKVTYYDKNGLAVHSTGIKTMLEPEVFKLYLNYSNKNKNYLNIYELKTSEEAVYYVLNINKKLFGFYKFAPTLNENDIDKRLSSIISILINAYIFLLLISIVISVIMSNNLTSGLRLLSLQFSKIQLSHNSPIKYKGKDEIGAIVDEYNKMLGEVEKMASNLAIQERESAWRDVARQVAHEINNPITPIKLNIQYLIKSANEHKDITPMFLNVSGSILEQIDNLSKIAQSFSTFAKMPEPNIQKVELISAVRSITKLMQTNEDIHVELKSPEKKIWIDADPNFINIIFINLVRNATHAVTEKEGASIIITIEKQSETVKISVADNGIGMDGEILNKIFLPNFTTKSSGTGVGLSMTKSMVHAMNGSIHVYSQPHVGTVFEISFPVAGD